MLPQHSRLFLLPALFFSQTAGIFQVYSNANSQKREKVPALFPWYLSRNLPRNLPTSVLSTVSLLSPAGFRIAGIFNHLHPTPLKQCLTQSRSSKIFFSELMNELNSKTPGGKREGVERVVLRGWMKRRRNDRGEFTRERQRMAEAGPTPSFSPQCWQEAGGSARYPASGIKST